MATAPQHLRVCARCFLTVSVMVLDSSISPTFCTVTDMYRYTYSSVLPVHDRNDHNKSEQIAATDTLNSAKIYSGGTGGPRAVSGIIGISAEKSEFRPEHATDVLDSRTVVA
jgi:hypothetical protein